jgi:hypothetical protein
LSQRCCLMSQQSRSALHCVQLSGSGRGSIVEEKEGRLAFRVSSRQVEVHYKAFLMGKYTSKANRCEVGGQPAGGSLSAAAAPRVIVTSHLCPRRRRGPRAAMLCCALHSLPPWPQLLFAPPPSQSPDKDSLAEHVSFFLYRRGSNTTRTKTYKLQCMPAPRKRTTEANAKK